MTACGGGGAAVTAVGVTPTLAPAPEPGLSAAIDKQAARFLQQAQLSSIDNAISSVRSGTGAEDQQHVGQGRLVPSTSVDPYAATLAQWFGVQDAELRGGLPNLDNFGGTTAVNYPTNLGFL